VNKVWQRLLAFGAAAALLAGSGWVRPQAANETAAAQAKLYRDFATGIEIIQANHIDQVEHDTLIKAGIQRMLLTLDPHSSFWDRKSFTEMNEEQRSQYFGIGALIGPRNRAVFIIEPFKNTPAVRAGLRYGDQIIEVDGKKTAGWTSDQVRNVLRGPKGTKVTVTVRRAGVAEPITVTLERSGVALPSIPTYYLARPSIGYINLRGGFHSTTSDELTRALADLKEQGATSLVLDLRDNRGGYLNEAIKVADKLLQRGQTIVAVRGRQGKGFDQEVRAESGSPETLPLVILINQSSASASEIVAGAIQDHDRGLIVGETSFGKGLVQHIFNLSGGAGLTLTIAHFYTPSGRLIQRDYSNGSFYDYLVRRNSPGSANSAKPASDERRTDLGRIVYGGGGIEPDIKVGNSFATTPTQNLLYHGLFMFVRELTAGQVAAAPNFKLPGIEFDHKLKPNEFLISDDVLKAYRDFMAKYIAAHPEIRLTPAMVDDNLVWARQQIRQEVLVAAYGTVTAQRALADLDLQLQRAITELPNAAQLAERAQRSRTTMRN
jgi:carboxyl-terminal processing protease